MWHYGRMKLSFILRKKVTTGVGASINFETVHSAKTTLAHNYRLQKREPKNLLRPDLRRANFSLFDGMTREDAQALNAQYNEDQKRRTKRAKTEAHNSWTDAVVNLPEPPADPALHDAWAAKEVYPKLRKLCSEIESKTGLQIRACVAHWDEGKEYPGGRVKYNGHAHLTFCRLQPDGKMIRFTKGDLNRLQDLTARVMQMRRGDKGTGKKHLKPDAYRAVKVAEEKAAAAQELRAAEQQKNEALIGTVEGLSAAHGAGQEKLAHALRERDSLAVELTDTKGALGALRTAQDGFSVRDLYHELRGAFQAQEGAIQAHLTALEQLYDRGNQQALENIHRVIHDPTLMVQRLETETGVDFDQIAQTKPQKRTVETRKTQAQNPRKAASSNDDGPEGP